MSIKSTILISVLSLFVLVGCGGNVDEDSNTGGGGYSAIGSDVTIQEVVEKA